MRVVNLRSTKEVYTSNSYLVLGDWNRIEDINTLVDVGVDGTIIADIENTATGFGKIPLEQVVLTHNHFDHAAGLSAVKAKFRPRVYAFSEMEGVDLLLEDGFLLVLGDREFEVIHSPGHSNDSVCLYCAKEKVLFSGDTPLHIKTPGGSYAEDFLLVLERLAGLEISVIYSGHDEPVTENAGAMIRNTLKNVNKTRHQKFSMKGVD